ncbi:hypothetical protein QWY77_01110 [Thalassotalea ponticola]|uniref:hypothetical protein n=1 Tax=Thalassotalea ponticola TaxID=1523392 RepID=UPI0025B4522F|nr:hypothetical protein [Thalassotalea ponticola]MDN3651384.1 hypothetical protein [Thalassotalea ponticola]
MSVSKHLTTLLCCCTLSSCSINDSSNSQPPISLTDPCEKINALLKEYDNNFDRLKLEQSNLKLSQVWKAKYHLVGESCQIWAWGTEKYTYACSLSAPNKQVIDQYFNNAKATAKRCLSNDWISSESTKADNQGYKIEFSSDKSSAKLAAHAVPSGNVFKSQWTIYYYFGNIAEPKSQ